MKKRLKTLLTLIVAVFAITLHAENKKPFVVPELTNWTGAEGTVDPSGRIVVRSKQYQQVATQLAEDYTRITGRKAYVSTGKTKAGDIVLTSKKLDSTPLEGYRLCIGEKVEIEAPSEAGAFWATQTLLQLLEQGPLPKGETLDVPQYRMRGLMLDVARKFIPIQYLHNLVRVMAYYKMNTLQLHLNDNGFRQYFGNDWDKTSAAFRLECDTYPGLTATDGSYSKAEFISLQKWAERLHVEIIPEIDAPAHVLAFTHYRPSLGSKDYGMDHFDLSNPDVYTFMDDLFKEYLSGKEPVFRGPRVNIGTDEYSNRDPEVVEQFRHFTDHYLTLVKQYGKHPALWGALTHAQGKTPVQSDDVLMNCWYNGYADPDSMAALGYQLLSIPDRDVYIVPAAGYYYDYLNCKNLYEHWTPASIGGKTFPEQHRQIEGGMFAVWNDHYGNGISTKDIHHRVFPALQTLSVKCWTGQLTQLPYAQFDELRTHLSEAPGINDLGRVKGNCSLASVTPEKPLSLPLDDVGYDYALSFDIDCEAEESGTIFTQSDYGTFYLSSPKDGKLAFERDGYLNTFNYKLPKTGKVSLRIEGTNKETRLFVDGKRIQVMKVSPYYAITSGDMLNTLSDNAPFRPTVYAANKVMYYVPTLFFPLKKAGNFKSRISNLNIHAL